ncbi:DUF4352 domain-containing protein [Gracilibacillus alcaliphilus]|uniref:DUF4352 domain-containing protein n=1 Tax=Gracilibacillus alcaliphilus TaxID=1401441 RepID=UPI00195D61BB|nr:DUF4352 domain-containing protein [Gracilibacillus alcaliphilus]MBM7676553.1 putative hemolysin [Gracilibacillus alcaliphilus]
MNKYKHITLLLLFIMGLLLAACSNEEEPVEDPEPTETEQSETDTSEETTAPESGEEAETEEDEGASSDEHIEHQLELSIGDTGTVVSSTDQLKYEVTLNEVSFQDELDNVPSYGNKFMIVNVTVENVDERAFEVADMFEPGIGVLDSQEYKPPVEADILQGVSDIELLDGELAPGDSVTGDYVFRMEEADNYSFTYGHEADQIITRAEWQFSADEVD